MTKDEALKMALETLETWKGYMPHLWDKTDEQTITAINEALAHSQQTDEKGRLMTYWGGLAQPEQHQDWCASLTQMLMSMPPKPAPCNCKPPQRKPLTDEQRDAIARQAAQNDWHDYKVIDAVEAAHGIKGEA